MLIVKLQHDESRRALEREDVVVKRELLHAGPVVGCYSALIRSRFDCRGFVLNFCILNIKLQSVHAVR